MSQTDQDLFSQILIARGINQTAQAAAVSAASDVTAAQKKSEQATVFAAERKADLQKLLDQLCAVGT